MRKWIAILAAAGGLWWFTGDEPTSRAAWGPGPQAAVLGDGFAVLAGKQLAEYDHAGRARHRTTLRLDRDEVRLVGAGRESVVAWFENGKVKLAGVLDDGRLGKESSWGKKARGLCSGTATNEHRWAVGWLEANGEPWFVHGPMTSSGAAAASVVEACAIEPATKATWCGVASADDKIVIAWREGGKLMETFCTARSCSNLVVRVNIDARDQLLSFGCVRDSCLWAVRTAGGATRLHRVDTRGRAIVRPLDRASDDTGVRVVGAGQRGFAVAYVTRAGRVAIQRVGVDGAITDVAELDGVEAPSLAWAAERLLVAPPAGEPVVIALPR